MLEARYADEEILVIDKPPGLPSQGGEGVKTSLIEAVERDFGFKPFLCHRLDKETAGLIVVARDARAASRWSELIAGKNVRKSYRALVAGMPRAARGTMEDSVRVRGEEKAANTAYRLLAAFGPPERRCSILELVLGTGRTHQIRLHLAGAGMPILGDDRHGDFALNKALKKECGLKRLLLLSYKLELPGSRTVIASLPEHFADFLSRFPDAPSWEELS